MSEKIFTARKGAVWMQLKPADNPHYLPCHTADDIEEAFGEKEYIYCFDKLGNYKPIGETIAPPDPIGTTLTTGIGKTKDWLERVLAPATLFFHQRQNGRADIFTNYQRVTIIKNVSLKTNTKSGIVSADEDAKSEHAFEVTAYPPSIPIFKLTAQRMAQVETEAINDIEFYSKPNQKLLVESDLYKYGAYVCDAATGVKANAYFTDDSGNTWTVGAADPFGNDEDIAAVVTFPISDSVVRVLMARGTTDAGNPPEVAYTDDEGSTYANVNVGSTNALYALSPKALFALDLYHIWLVTGSGHVYFSDDGGVTWAAQDAGVTTVQNLHCVHFADELNGFAGGANNALLKTIDGGNVWTAVTGPTGHTTDTIASVHVIDEDWVWVAYDDGTVYHSEDGGSTWVQASFSNSGSGEIKDIRFLDELIGFMVKNISTTVGSVTTVTAHFYRTFNGGKDWEEFSLPTNAGLNAVYPVNQNLAFGVGEPQGATAFLMQAVGG